MGPGLTAPHSLQWVQIQLAGDASGGVLSISFQTDPRWTSIITFCCATVTGLATAQDVTFALNPRVNFRQLSTRAMRAPDILSTADGSTWELPLALMSLDLAAGGVPGLAMNTDNVDNTTWQLNAQVCCFAKDAFRKVPLQTLFAVRPS